MRTDLLLTELQYKAVRSSGAGGQNVNKVSSKAVLSFDLENSAALSEEEKIRAKSKLVSRLTSDGMLILNCDEDRSQLKNKSIVVSRLLDILTNALLIPKIRKPTKIPKSVIRKRLHDKKNIAQTKQFRRKPEV